MMSIPGGVAYHSGLTLAALTTRAQISASFFMKPASSSGVPPPGSAPTLASWLRVFIRRAVLTDLLRVATVGLHSFQSDQRHPGADVVIGIALLGDCWNVGQQGRALPRRDSQRLQGLALNLP